MWTTVLAASIALGLFAALVVLGFSYQNADETGEEFFIETTIENQVAATESFEAFLTWLAVWVPSFNMELLTPERVVSITDTASRKSQHTSIRFKREGVQRGTATSDDPNIAKVAGEIKIIWATTGKKPNFTVVLSGKGNKRIITSISLNVQ